MRALRWYVLGILIVSNLLIWFAVVSRTSPGVLTVAFLDIGQGDATFIESPNGAQVLIDGGSGRSILQDLGERMGFFDRTIDVVIATHPDKDHIGGLPDVLDMYNVSYILDPGIAHETGSYTVFIERSSDEPNAEVLLGRRGQIINLGEGVYLRVLFPDRDVQTVETNAGSIVVQLVYRETAFLLTGDAPTAIEDYVLSLDWTTLQSDLLKVGHHGSKTSSAEHFVGVVSPKYAVISRGCDNRYGHPHTEVLAILTGFEVEILDTCEDGTVVFESDGEHVTLQ